MSLWWTKRNQLDTAQLNLIEKLTPQGNYLITGPPGSGKTNVLLRRAQFLRGLGISNILVITFTRPLTEFVKTGCYDDAGREIFPPSCVTTVESWIRSLYDAHGTVIPASSTDFQERKKALAIGAFGFRAMKKFPQYETLFIDEAQDLLEEEIALFRDWADNLFLVGDDRQQIFESRGIDALRALIAPIEKKLSFHYRLSPEICKMADKILTPANGGSLASSCQYNGPTPASIILHDPCSRNEQLEIIKERLKNQLRVYGGFVADGDRFGVIVGRQIEREEVLEALDSDPDLSGKAQILRSRNEGESDFDPTIDTSKSISIVTLHGSKGIEFRGVHWFNSDSLLHHRTLEQYYTAVTRAKTELDIYCEKAMPAPLAKSYSQQRGAPQW